MSRKKDEKTDTKFSTKKLNDVKAEPIKQKGGSKKPAKGEKLFPEPYANICIMAKKKSGKTTVVKKIIEDCATKNTIVIVFCSSFHKDASWRAIEEWCDDHEIPIEGHTSLFDSDKNNLLEQELGDLKEPKDDEKKAKAPPIKRYIEIDDEHGFVEVLEPVADAEPKPKRETKFTPLDYIFVFDDIGDELRHKTVSQLMKTNRHWKCKVVVSTQYMTDLAPSARRQFDYWLLFAKLSRQNLNVMRVSAGLDLEEDEFVELYSKATAKPYDFLYVDTRDMTYRIKFDTAIIPQSPPEKAAAK